ncbi:hypothetical protein BV22DRAFT_1029949 [Leucogyrophana mollusca]|uniref:Uncharacterized protein n=1 Tax=Leucogyrophana mollusca TaxID=85980 RepID=A0ACB8BUP0_9AGAM|nr:hypothetical protein BV22DRAFT_1029949 [Leucogyrophana mollusca]
MPDRDETTATAPDPWTNTTEDGEWGSAWTPDTVAEPSNEQEPEDEWEAARHEKEKMDRAVPPQFLADLLKQCHELWPDPEPTTGADNWRADVDGLQGVLDILNSLVPEHSTLPPSTPFAQTATSKSMHDALRLTRHMPLAQNSPLARFLASKGSSEWEASIKAQKEIVQDEVAVPVGWRILEKDKEATEESTTKPTKPSAGTGLLSFWTRRASSVNVPRERSQSPAPTARSSADSVRSVHPPPVPPEKTDTNSSKLPAYSASAVSSPLPTPNTSTPEISLPALAAPPAPSAVSRFLNRFSRTKSGASQLALSSDDLEFLSTVPSAHDPDNDGDDGDGFGLGRVMKAAPVPLPAKLPPPIAPPPKPPTSRPTSGIGVRSSSSNVNLNVTPPPGASSSHVPSSLAQPLSPTISRPHTPASIAPPSFSVPRLSSPPPPPSRVRTPFTLSPPLLPPPPPPISPPQTPRPGTSWAGPFKSSEDEFSDFYSPEQVRREPYMDSPGSSIHSPSSAHRLTSPGLGLPPLLPPPPASTSKFVSPPHTPRPTTPPRLSSLEDDREHDDFLRDFTHRKSSSIAQSESGSSIRSPSSLHRLTTSRPSLSFDDFDDFVSSGIRTPSPPPLPAKVLSPPQAPLSPHTQSVTQTQAKGPSFVSQSPSFVAQSQHQRTQSLVQQAASLGGQWPASPPPQAPSQFGVDLIDTGAPYSGTSGGGGNGGMMSWASSPVLMHPQSRPIQKPLQLGQKPPVEPSLMRPMVAPPPFPGTPNSLSFSSLQSSSASAAQPRTGTGGLSAQDLSFFEGL